MFLVDTRHITVRAPDGSTHPVTWLTADLFDLEDGDMIDAETAARIMESELAVLNVVSAFAKLNEQRRERRKFKYGDAA